MPSSGSFFIPRLQFALLAVAPWLPGMSPRPTFGSSGLPPKTACVVRSLKTSALLVAQR